MPIDPSVDAALQTAAARGILGQADDQANAIARQRDGNAFDMRALGATIARQLVAAPDPVDFADLNQSARNPTTIEHPTYTAPPGYPQPAAAPAPPTSKAG